MSFRYLSEEEVNRLVTGPGTGPGRAGQNVARVRFSELSPGSGAGGSADMGKFMDIPVLIEAELGTKSLSVKEVLDLREGSVIELNKPAGELVEVYVNGCLVGQGEIVVINEVLGLRIARLAREGREGVYQPGS